jgi:hypothetical protein
MNNLEIAWAMLIAFSSAVIFYSLGVRDGHRVGYIEGRKAVRKFYENMSHANR